MKYACFAILLAMAGCAADSQQGGINLRDTGSLADFRRGDSLSGNHIDGSEHTSTTLSGTAQSGGTQLRGEGNTQTIHNDASVLIRVLDTVDKGFDRLGASLDRYFWAMLGLAGLVGVPQTLSWWEQKRARRAAESSGPGATGAKRGWLSWAGPVAVWGVSAGLFACSVAGR